jgi:hypothetical protein
MATAADLADLRKHLPTNKNRPKEGLRKDVRAGVNSGGKFAFPNLSKYLILNVF